MEAKEYAKRLRRPPRVNDILAKYQKTYIAPGDEVKEVFRDLVA